MKNSKKAYMQTLLYTLAGCMFASCSILLSSEHIKKQQHKNYGTLSPLSTPLTHVSAQLDISDNQPSKAPTTEVQPSLSQRIQGGMVTFFLGKALSKMRGS